MSLARTPLLSEGVKRRMKQWEKAHDQLHRVTRKGYKKLARQTADWEKRRPEETPEQHAQRLAGPEDVTGSFHDRIVNEPRTRAKLDRAKALEAKRRAQLDRAEQEREQKRRRKQMMAAPVPSLEPVRTRTPAAVVQAAQKVVRARRVKKLVSRRRA